MSPPTEAVAEFKFQTGTLGAEYGGAQTAVANFVVKSGTNEFHGSGAVYLMDGKWDARPFVAKALNQNTPVRNQQNGAVAIGGPILIPRLFNAAIAASSSPRSKNARARRVPHIPHPPSAS